jgi:hypothetical protein
MNKTITEAKIRSIVKSELKQFLINEGFFDTIKGGSKTGMEATKKALSPAFDEIESGFRKGAGKEQKANVSNLTQFNEIKPQLQFLKPEMVPLFNKLYEALYTAKNTQEELNLIKKLALSVTKCKNILTKKYITLPAEEYRIDEQVNSEEIIKQIKVQLTSVHKKVVKIQDDSQTKKQVALYSAATIVRNLVVLTNLAINMNKIDKNVRDNLNQLFTKIINHFEQLLSNEASTAAPPTAPTP